MSHQVNFYLTPGDMTHLESALHEKTSALVLPSRLEAPNAAALERLPIEGLGSGWLDVFLVREDDVNALQFRGVPMQRYWTVDLLRSPAIEYSRCYFDGKRLRRGRLYFQAGYYDEDRSWVEKPKPFLDFAARVLTTARKALRRHPDLREYVGPEAWDLYSSRSVEFTFM